MAYVTRAKYPLVDPTATIYIHGLLAVCFKGKDKCTIAVNDEPAHTPIFQVWETNPCKELLRMTPSGTDPIKINVTKTATPPAVEVYNGMPMFVKQRYNFINRCVDVEAIHGKPIPNKQGTLWPRVETNDGVFCGYKLSSGPFDFTDLAGTVLKDLDLVSLGITGDIFLDNSSDSIEVTGGGISSPLKLSYGKQYEIGITNLCYSNPTRLDFEDHYRVLEVSVLPKPKYTLHNRTGVGTITQVQMGNCVAKMISPFSDRTPCMAAVFGQTDEFVA